MVAVYRRRWRHSMLLLPCSNARSATFSCEEARQTVRSVSRRYGDSTCDCPRAPQLQPAITRVHMQVHAPHTRTRATHTHTHTRHAHAHAHAHAWHLTKSAGHNRVLRITQSTFVTRVPTRHDQQLDCLNTRLQRGILHRYRNHDDSLLVSDNDVARDHGHFSTSDGHLNFYVQTIRSTGEHSLPVRTITAYNESLLHLRWSCVEERIWMQSTARSCLLLAAQFSPDGWWNVLLV